MSLSNFINIKNFKEAIHSRLKAKDSLQEIVNSFPIPLFIMDKEGKILNQNEACRKIADGLSNLRDLEHYIQDDEKDKLSQFIGQCFQPLKVKVHLKGKEYNKVIYLYVWQAKEKAALFFATFYSVDKIHSLQNWRGKISERFAAEVFEQTHDAALVITRDATIVAYNAYLEKLSPFPISLKANFSECLSPDSALEFNNALQVVNTHNPCKKSLAIKFKETEKSEISGFLKPLANELILVHFLKISEQENLQLQLLQSQKLHAMGELAGGIAHDFNNLLTAMIGFCDLLLMRHSPGDQSFTDIMQIKQNANRAANLVRQLLAFSRQQTLQPRKIDVTDNLAELKVLLQRLIGTSIDLNIIHGRDLGFVHVDQGQLEQVIINLVVNARDAMPQGGTISVKTHAHEIPTVFHHPSGVIPKGTYVVIEIVDTGTGIAEEHLPRIFDPFFTTKEVGMGTGLGLSTVYGILTQMEGFIIVDTIINQGTTFKIYLPQYQLEKDEVFPQNQNETLTKDLTGNSVILLVEDEIAVRKFSSRTLQEKGYEVIEAQNGREAYEYLVTAVAKGDVIDLLITDVVMPEMDGPELVERAQGLISDLKVIFMSGYAESTFRHRLSKDRDIHFLPKPFNLKDLAMKVKDITGGKSKKNEVRRARSVISNYGGGISTIYTPSE